MGGHLITIQKYKLIPYFCDQSEQTDHKIQLLINLVTLIMQL